MIVINEKVIYEVLSRLLFSPPTEDNELVIPCLATGDWDIILKAGQREGVAPLLYFQLRRRGLTHLVPEEIQKDMVGIYHRSLHATLRSLGELRTVFRGFRGAGIPLLVLKGVALGERVYPHPNLRISGDCDILIHREDLIRSDGLLRSLGFRPVDIMAADAQTTPVGYLTSVEYQRDVPSPRTIHVHWHLVNTSVPATAYVQFMDMREIWARSVTASVADTEVRVLCPEHLVIYLCEHALRVGHSFDRLILVCDIYYVLRTFEKDIDWEFLVAESRRFHVERLVYHGLFIVSHYTRQNPPPAVMAALKPSRLTMPERFFLKLQMDNKRLRGSSYLLHLALHKQVRKKMHFIKATFFPPPSVLCQRRYAGSSPRSLAIFYAERVREVISHIVYIAKGAIR